MKKLAVLFLGSVLTLTSIQSVKADILANWTFENLATNLSYAPGANIGTTNFFAELGTQAGIAAAVGLHATAATYSDPAGNGSLRSLSANNWSQNDYFQFSVTLDLINFAYSGINVSYAQNGSASGPKNYFISYSTDGSSFTKFGSDYGLASGITWNNTTTGQATLLSDDFSSITALNTASTVFFRVVDDSVTTGGAINGGNVGTAGTGRIDDFIINATVTPVPEPASLALVAVGGAACLVAFRRRR